MGIAAAQGTRESADRAEIAEAEGDKAEDDKETEAGAEEERGGLRPRRKLCRNPGGIQGEQKAEAELEGKEAPEKETKDEEEGDVAEENDKAVDTVGAAAEEVEEVEMPATERAEMNEGGEEIGREGGLIAKGKRESAMGC